MNGTFNVVEGSQLQKAMALQNGNGAPVQSQEGYAPFITGGMLHAPSTQMTPMASNSNLPEDEPEKQENEEKQSQQSFGTGSFTTNTFNAKLRDSCGMSILQYIQSENFGQFGESMKLIGSVHEFIQKLTVANQKLEEENESLMVSNEKYQRVIVKNNKHADVNIDRTHNLGKEISAIEQTYMSYHGKENRYA